jgi:hypothetical protein
MIRAGLTIYGKHSPHTWIANDKIILFVQTTLVGTPILTFRKEGTTDCKNQSTNLTWGLRSRCIKLLLRKTWSPAPAQVCKPSKVIHNWELLKDATSIGEKDIEQTLIPGHIKSPWEHRSKPNLKLFSSKLISEEQNMYCSQQNL